MASPTSLWHRAGAVDGCSASRRWFQQAARAPRVRRSGRGPGGHRLAALAAAPTVPFPAGGCLRLLPLEGCSGYCGHALKNIGINASSR